MHEVLNCVTCSSPGNGMEEQLQHMIELSWLVAVGELGDG